MKKPSRIIPGISGASGATYARRALELLKFNDAESPGVRLAREALVWWI